jgi:myosin-7
MLSVVMLSVVAPTSHQFYWQSEIHLISGYHQCTKEEASILGALIYRVKYGESKQELQNLTQMLRELLPTDLVRKPLY